MRSLLLILSFSLLTACAGVTPQQTVTNTLLGVHDTIVNVETGIKQPCATGVIPAADCATLRSYLSQAKPAYNTAVDAQVIWLASGLPANQTAFAVKKQALDSLVGNALALAVKYGVNGSPK